MAHPVTLFWHRRDLRIEDNRGLHAALESGHPVQPVFIFDTNILAHLPEKDGRVEFIHKELSRLRKAYQAHRGDLLVIHGKPEELWPQLLERFDVKTVWCNRDYEPYAQTRDHAVHALLEEHGIPFKGAKDHVIFEKSEVTKDDGLPYTVFTPYMRKWKKRWEEDPQLPCPSESLLDQLHSTEPYTCPTLADLGFASSELEFPKREVSNDLLRQYGDRRDLPAVHGTSRLSLHLRFGTVSIRACVQKALATSEKWWNELIWRDFYQMIIFHFPHSVDQAFKPAYDHIPWRTDQGHFEAWCEGRTGYPLVDAGMRELNRTGFMHNRVRMVVASFFTKHLLLDWRLGERYFAEKLLDFELASNVGGWQWAAGSGCDAAPYFRVFNPESQWKKFDPDSRYVRKWVPEYQQLHYPKPIVDHKFARQRAIETYKAALDAVKS